MFNKKETSIFFLMVTFVLVFSFLHEPLPVPAPDHLVQLHSVDEIVMAEYIRQIEVYLEEIEENTFELRPVNTASRGREYQELFVEATAYTAGLESTGKNPGDPAYGITKSGFTVDAGVIAVDPKVIPLGSICWVEGYGYAVALDIGGAIQGERVDVFFWDLDEALRWGRRQVRVRVY